LILEDHSLTASGEYVITTLIQEKYSGAWLVGFVQEYQTEFNKLLLTFTEDEGVTRKNHSFTM